MINDCILYEFTCNMDVFEFCFSYIVGSIHQLQDLKARTSPQTLPELPWIAMDKDDHPMKYSSLRYLSHHKIVTPKNIPKLLPKAPFLELSSLK